VKVVQGKPLTPAQWKRIDQFFEERDIEELWNWVESLTWFAKNYPQEELVEE
jgi:hypothetical protein